jgi:hypothetical protein
MAPKVVARAATLSLLALAYACAFLWLAATGARDLLAPFGWGTIIVAPAATGLLLSLYNTAPNGWLTALGSVLISAIAGATAISLGWLPLAWFAFAGPWIVGGALAGGIAGPILPDIRMRSAIAAAMAIAPILLGRLEVSAEQSGADVTATSLADVAAPSMDVWEEIIGSDSVGPAIPDTTRRRASYPGIVAIAIDEPRPLTLRHIVFSDSTRVDERVVQWDDGEWLRVLSGPQVVAVPRGLAAWRAGWGAGAVIPVGTTYELISDGDSTSTVRIEGTWRLAIHARAYPPGWVQRVAQARNDILASAIRSRSEVRVRTAEPALTAEMKVLRAQLIADLESADDISATAPIFVNGDRAIEVADDRRPPVSSAEEAQAVLRTSLRGISMRARTTGMAVAASARAPGDTSTTANVASLEFEDYTGRCVQEVVALIPDAGGRLRVTRAVNAPQARMTCLVDAMAERAYRSRMIAQLALAAGDVNDNWSVALLARGVARVYLDSVVIRADTLRLRVNTQDGSDATVDSIVVGLSQKTEQSWYMTQRGAAIVLNQTFRNKQEWNGPRARFTIPADSSIDLTKVWPTFEVILSVPKTESNTVGRAWTYSHAPMVFFSGIRR